MKIKEKIYLNLFPETNNRGMINNVRMRTGVHILLTEEKKRTKFVKSNLYSLKSNMKENIFVFNYRNDNVLNIDLYNKDFSF